jgi:hypothetical protein
MYKIKNSIAVIKGMAANKNQNINKMILADMAHVLENNINQMVTNKSLEDKILEAVG